MISLGYFFQDNRGGTQNGLVDSLLTPIMGSVCYVPISLSEL
jgi:hypothetical protein